MKESGVLDLLSTGFGVYPTQTGLHISFFSNWSQSPEGLTLLSKLGDIERIQIHAAVDDAMIATIAKLPTLKTVVLANPWCSDELVARLKKSLPSVDVVRAQY